MKALFRRTAGLLDTPLNAAISLAVLLLCGWVGFGLLRWGVLDATWQGSAADCAARGGACWAFLAEKARFILFALYPNEALWRPTLAILILASLAGVSLWPRAWSLWLLPLWIGGFAFALWLMGGGVVLTAIPTTKWGGLPVTLLVWLGCGLAGFPIAILMALARRSRLGLLRLLATAVIELMRATPMVAILYIAMLLLPMALPEFLAGDKLLRVSLLVTLFWSTYVAEVIRAGLQAIPPGQFEAGYALGLGYWRVVGFIILPQALRLVIPGLVNLAIGFFLATSLLAVIGILDLLNAAKTSAVDPNWLGFYDEAYLFAATIFFVVSALGSRYAQWLERRLGQGLQSGHR